MPSDSRGTPCRLCGHHEFQTLMDFGEQPIAHRLLVSPQDQEEVFPLQIELCERCGLGQIRQAIDPATLYGQYNYGFSSWKTEPHLTHELDMLTRHTAASRVFEIACNDGRFLAEMRARGSAEAFGLEPNPDAAEQATRRGFRVYQTFLADEVCDQILRDHPPFDVVVARQVLEHLQDIALLFRCADRLLADDGVFFIDLPDIVPFLRAGDCTFAWEEHVNYFTPETLSYALALHGFEPLEGAVYNYSGGTQAVLATRRRSLASRDAYGSDLSLMKALRPRVDRYRGRLAERLTAERAAGVPIVVYGVGCRACVAVNGLSLGPLIDFAVDDRLERQGKYMPGSRLEIRSPAAIPSGALILLAVNQENESTVKDRLFAALPGTRWLSVLGPDPVDGALEKLATS